MNHSTIPAQSAFTPEPGLPWLRHDPTMQCRESFTDTTNVQLHKGFHLLGEHFPGGTSLLLRRVRSTEAIVPGAMYAFTETDLAGCMTRGDQTWFCDFARAIRVERQRTIHRHPFFELSIRYANIDAAKRLYSWAGDDGLSEWRIWPDGYGHESLRKEAPDYKGALWQVTHYIDLPTHLKDATLDTADDTTGLYGATSAQHRFMRDERAVCGNPTVGEDSQNAAILTLTTTGQRYPLRLDECLSRSDARAVTELLQELPGLCPAHAGRHKSPVRLELRTAAGTSCRHYSEAAVRVVLNLVESIRREREAREALSTARVEAALRKQQPAAQPAQATRPQRAAQLQQPAHSALNARPLALAHAA